MAWVRCISLRVGGIEGAERLVIVKLIRRDHETDASFLARFLDEARIQSQLQHPGVAQIIEAANDGAGNAVVEYIEGRNLADVRSRTAQLGVGLGGGPGGRGAERLAGGVGALVHVRERRAERDRQGLRPGHPHAELSGAAPHVGEVPPSMYSTTTYGCFGQRLLQAVGIAFQSHMAAHGARQAGGGCGAASCWGGRLPRASPRARRPRTRGDARAEHQTFQQRIGCKAVGAMQAGGGAFAHHP